LLRRSSSVKSRKGGKLLLWNLFTLVKNPGVYD
jgi:hypothetical protein